MKQSFLKILFLIIFFIGMNDNYLHSANQPDFNYPKTVSKTALADIDKAVKTANKPLLVDALIRHIVAQQLISQDNAPDLIALLEQHINAEKSSDYKAIITLLEIDLLRQLAINSLNSNEVHEQYPNDLSQWNKHDFNRRLAELQHQVLEKPQELLSHKITEYTGFITCSSKQATIFPTLLDFVYCKAISGNSNENLKLLNQWAEYHKGDVAPSIYIENSIAELDFNNFDSKRIALYKRYAQFEQSGMVLKNIDANIENYGLFKDYLARFPKSEYSPAIKNIIYQIEEKSVNIQAPRYHSSAEKIPLEITNKNATDFNICVYTVDYDKKNRKTPGKLLKSYTIHNSKAIPFNDEAFTYHIDPLPFGEYLILPRIYVNGKPKELTKTDYYYAQTTSITNIYPFSFATKNGTSVYAVDRTTGKPIKGANLMLKDKLIGTTNGNGEVKIASNDVKQFNAYKFLLGDDTHSQTFHLYQHNFTIKPKTQTRIFTDLAIYRPGETINYSAIIFNQIDGTMEPMKGNKIAVEFLDNNWKIIDQDTLISDEMGRISGTFTVPHDRMNGSFIIRIPNISVPQVKWIEVSEYKVPTFEVTLINAKRSYNVGEDVVINGTASTYAGMPVANTKINITLNKQPWFFWYQNRGDEQLLSTQVATNENGEFTVTLARDLFNDSNKSFYGYCYNLNAECTNNTGETQSCQHSFFIGTLRSITFNGAMEYINDAPLTLPVTIESSDDADNNFTCNYVITALNDSTKVLHSGTFTSSKPQIDLRNMPSGTYAITVTDASHLAKEAKSQITIYRKGDKQCPIDKDLWIPECGRHTDANNMANITLGTSRSDVYVYYCASSTQGVTQGWKHISNGLHTLQLPMPDGVNQELTVSLCCVYNGNLITKALTFISPERVTKAVVEATSFRDKTTPGANERWTFRLRDNHGNPMSGAAMLAITNKAINTIANNIWANYKPQFAMPLMHYAHFSDINTRSYTHDLWRHGFINAGIDDINTIDFNYYGYNPSSFIKGVIEYKYSTAYGAAPRMMKREALVAANDLPESAIMHQDEEADEGFYTRSDNGSSVNDLSKIALREQEVKTALWNPNLVTDEQGNYAVEFEVPNFNTTWIMQTLAYTAQGYFEGLQRQVVSSKPIMVKANMPRFLRVGDNATLAANVANKSDESATVNGIIELFDPRTGKAIATKSFNLTLDAMCDAAVDINYTATTDASFIGFRIKASNGNFGDGEQVMVPILSNISPITETMPFFINANDFDFTAQFPNMKGAEKAVIEYCDNPVWYCATALPTIFDNDAKTSTQLIHSLFALKLAQGLAKQNPKLADAIDYWKQQSREKSPLTSALERNSDLKIGTLLASPWINEADRQTLQMSKLHELFNDSICQKTAKEIVTRLHELQMSDGGFTWVNHPACKSSLFCTGDVLEVLGRLKMLGYLKPDQDINDMIKRAVDYYDRKHLELFVELKKNDNMISYDDYAFVRTLHNDIAVPSGNKPYINRILNDIEKGWKNHSLARKAFFALTLQNNGKTASARQITESIRQFSITTEQRGMYWDRIDNGWWRGRNPLAVTSVILQALQQVDNRTDEINQIRKWILLNKQTNDWGGSSLASEAVYTILATGSDWLTQGTMPHITIGDTPIIFDEIDKFLGYSRKEVPVADVMGKALSINRNQNTSPAWGALYLQGKAPMKSIKSACVDDLSIEKSLLTFNADGTLSKATSLKVGDKVRVQCTIKCGKRLEYLTVTDERGACFEPVDKTSQYDNQNGTWMYREIKDSQTNIFITSLNKGTYVISYDVYVTNPGSFDVGIATVQCQYAPQFTAHSAGSTVQVN